MLLLAFILPWKLSGSWYIYYKKQRSGTSIESNSNKGKNVPLIVLSWTIWKSHCFGSILPIPGPLVAILFRIVPRLIFWRIFSSVLLQGHVFKAAITCVSIRKLSSNLGGWSERSILTILASYRVIFPRWFLITIGVIGCRPVRIYKAAIVFATTVADLRLRFTVPVNWNQVQNGKTAIPDRDVLDRLIEVSRLFNW